MVKPGNPGGDAPELMKKKSETLKRKLCCEALL